MRSGMRVGRHLFERYRDVEIHVPGTVDGTHPALAEEGIDAVAVVDDLACREWHGCPSLTQDSWVQV